MSQLIDTYIVKRPFDYNGESYAVGDSWEPAGKRWDKLIMEHNVVKQTVPAGSEKGELDGLLAKSANELRQALKAQGLPIYGPKQQLAERLLEAAHVNA